MRGIQVQGLAMFDVVIFCEGLYQVDDLTRIAPCYFLEVSDG